MPTVVQRRLMVINQGGGGGVTAVTASAPLAITGAPATPNVILSGAGALVGDVLAWNGVAWVPTPGAGGLATLQVAYDNGPLVNLDATGGIQFLRADAQFTAAPTLEVTNAEDSAGDNTLTINRSPVTTAAAGFGIGVTMGANSTAAGISVSAVGTAAGSHGIEITKNGAGGGHGLKVVTNGLVSGAAIDVQHGGATFPGFHLNNIGSGPALLVEDGGFDVFTIDAFGAFTVVAHDNGTVGSVVSLTAGAGVAGANAGGGVNLTGGAGTGVAAGGQVTLTGGTSATGLAGGVTNTTSRSADATAATSGPALTLSQTGASGAAGGVGLFAGTLVPSALGVAAPEGSLYLRSTAGTGELYLKSGAGNTAWTQTGSSASQQIVIPGLTTGGLGNGDFGYISAAMTVGLTDASVPVRSICIGANEGTVGSMTVQGVIELAKFDGVGFAPLNGASVFLSLATPGTLTAAAPVVSGNTVADVGICLDNALWPATCKVLLQVKSTVGIL